MKIRNDFVSNSSSCSFIIDTKLSKFSNVISIFENVDIPYSFENTVTVSIYVKYKNYIALKNLLIELEYCNDDRYCSDYTHKQIKENPDEVSWNSFEITFAQLCLLPKSAFELIDSICFSADNYGDGLMHLKSLFDFCKINDCEPNDENTEFDFTDECHEFYKLMLKKVEHEK